MNSFDRIVKVLLIFAGAFSGYAFVSFAAMGYHGTALLFLVTIMIPVSMLVYEYCVNPE